MTKNRAKKQATRAKMQTTGENYTQASHSSAADDIIAWDDEWEHIVIYGTHDAQKARTAFQRSYLEDCGFKPGDPEWLPEIDDITFYENMSHLWTLPKEDETPFDVFKENGPGRIPYMYTTL